MASPQQLKEHTINLYKEEDQQEQDYQINNQQASPQEEYYELDQGYPQEFEEEQDYNNYDNQEEQYDQYNEERDSKYDQEYEDEEGEDDQYEIAQEQRQNMNNALMLTQLQAARQADQAALVAQMKYKIKSESQTQSKQDISDMSEENNVNNNNNQNLPQQGGKAQYARYSKMSDEEAEIEYQNRCQRQLELLQLKQQALKRIQAQSKQSTVSINKNISQEQNMKRQSQIEPKSNSYQKQQIQPINNNSNSGAVIINKKISPQQNNYLSPLASEISSTINHNKENYVTSKKKVIKNNIPQRQDPDNKLSMMYEYQMQLKHEKNLRSEHLRLQQEQRALSQCTFTPKLTEKAYMLSLSNHNYLPIEDKTAIFMQRKKLLDQLGKIQKNSIVEQECTFTPVLNTRKPYSSLEYPVEQMSLYDRQIEWQKKVQEKNYERMISVDSSVMASVQRLSYKRQSSKDILSPKQAVSRASGGFFSQEKISPSFILYLSSKYDKLKREEEKKQQKIQGINNSTSQCFNHSSYLDNLNASKRESLTERKSRPDSSKKKSSQNTSCIQNQTSPSKNTTQYLLHKNNQSNQSTTLKQSSFSAHFNHQRGDSFNQNYSIYGKNDTKAIKYKIKTNINQSIANQSSLRISSSKIERQNEAQIAAQQQAEKINFYCQGSQLNNLVVHKNKYVLADEEVGSSEQNYFSLAKKHLAQIISQKIWEKENGIGIRKVPT